MLTTLNIVFSVTYNLDLHNAISFLLIMKVFSQGKVLLVLMFKQSIWFFFCWQIMRSTVNNYSICVIPNSKWHIIKYLVYIGSLRPLKGAGALLLLLYIGRIGMPNMRTWVLRYGCNLTTKREEYDGGEHNVGQLVHQQFLVTKFPTLVMVSLGNQKCYDTCL